MSPYIYIYINIYYYSEETTYCVVFEMVAHTKKICTNTKAAVAV